MILSILCLILAVAAYSVSHSYLRKYKTITSKTPAFFGSTTFLVFLTDGYHLMQAISMLCLSLSFGFLMGNHWISLGAWVTIHLVHYITYKLLSR